MQKEREGFCTSPPDDQLDPLQSAASPAESEAKFARLRVEVLQLLAKSEYRPPAGGLLREAPSKGA